MPVTRKLIAQDDNDDNQWLRVDHSSRYIVNDMDDWQALFGPNSELSNSVQVVKLSAKFDEETFNNIKIAAYLYDSKNASTALAASCSFKIYKVISPDWSEQLITTISGTELSNSYFYSNPTITSLGIDFDGGDTIMIEATMLRLGVVYRDRLYFNHLGIYDSVTRVKKFADYLDITKKDE